MPFEARPVFQTVKLPDIDTSEGDVVVVREEDDGAAVLSVVDDNEVMLLVKDKPASTDDILFLRDNNDGVALVQDAAAVAPVDPVFLTDAQETLLVDAGPVFRGPPGGKGDPGVAGLSLFEVWQTQAGNQNGTFDDFMNYVRQGLGTGKGSAGTFVFVQLQPAIKWIIVHNLNTYPLITCEDSAGEAFDADYSYLNENVIEIDLISPTAGKAYLN